VARLTCRRTALLSNSKSSGPSAASSPLLHDVSSPPSSALPSVLMLFSAYKRTHVYGLMQPPHVRHFHCHHCQLVICGFHSPPQPGCWQRAFDVVIAWAQLCHRPCCQRHQMSSETSHLQFDKEMSCAILSLASSDFNASVVSPSAPSAANRLSAILSLWSLPRSPGRSLRSCATSVQRGQT
jgi:hypothetical protein